MNVIPITFSWRRILVYNLPVRPAIVLFAKAPVPGRAKTRLAFALGDVPAAALHTAFARDLLEKISRLSHFAEIQLHTDVLTDEWGDVPVARRLQASGDLQLKMLHAFENAFAEQFSPVAIIGSDAPTLPDTHIVALLGSAADVTFGPCEDGGYWGIACRRVHPAMFQGVQWSTAQALEQSEAAVRACGLSAARGPLWFDVDEPRDLERLVAAGDLPRHTAAWVQARMQAAGTQP
jgi:uncharacterized protein